MQKRSVLLNSLMSVVQVVVNGASMLVLYRFLLDTIGETDFGVWALVLAWTSASSIANLGLSGSTLKFVPQYLARGDRPYVVRIIHTAALSVGAFLGVLLLVLYPAFDALLHLVIEDPGKAALGLSVLPYALVSFWLTSVAFVFLSSIDGHQRVDLRSLILSCSALLYLGLALWLVPGGGLIGLAQAQVIQATLLLFMAIAVLKRLLPALPLITPRWSGPAFREMIGYSLNFQAISFAQMLFEPVTKSFLSRFAGVDTVTFFEMAHKLVFQLRALIVSAHQALVPTIANLQETNPGMLQRIYQTSFHLLLYLILSSLPFLIGMTPVISRLWIGAYEPTFVLFASLLFTGWFLNMFANPAYFAYLGTGNLRWNVGGHLIMGGLNLLLGLLLGWRFGGTGVVAGFIAALLTGSIVITTAYQRSHHIRFSDLVRPDSLLLGAAGLLGLALITGLTLQYGETLGAISLGALQVGIYAAVIALPLWRHEMRSRVQDWITTLLLRKPAPESKT